MFVLNIHSIVDVITNSSTVIYTYQNNKKEATELLQEILNLIGDDHEVEDLFYIGTFYESSTYSDYLSHSQNEYPKNYPNNYKEQYKYIENIIESVLKGEIIEPEWMKEIENCKDFNDCTRSTRLIIIPKDEKYYALANKMIKFLNSIESDADYDG